MSYVFKLCKSILLKHVLGLDVYPTKCSIFKVNILLQNAINKLCMSAHLSVDIIDTI